MSLHEIIEAIGIGLDVAGVAVIGLGALYSGYRALLTRGSGASYSMLRQNLGRSILLGLELLVAGDIIRTVAIEPTVETVLILGGIVVIRTFLSTALQVELDGRWPWKRDPDQAAHKSSEAGGSEP